MLRYLRFGLAFPMLLITMAGLIVGGPWMWAGFVTSTLLMVLGDEFLPEDRDVAPYRYPRLLTAQLFCSLPFLIALFGVLIWMAAPSGDPLGLGRWVLETTGWSLFDTRDRTDWVDMLGGVLGTMMMSAISGMNFAHELIHQVFRRGNGSRVFFARLLAIFSFDGPGDNLHLLAHHVEVGMPSDPSTAVRGESAYAFLVKAIVYGNVCSWNIEVARMRRLGRSTFSWRNRFLTGHAMSIGLTFVAYHMSGWRGVGVFIVTALLSKSVLELINYIQHYGLVRLEGTPIAMHHCWNSNKRVSTYLLCNATRHSSHHIDPYQPFWLLKPMPEAPTLPLGYFSSMFVALVPPVWHRLMASRLLNWDDHFASPEERHVAALHNERSGVRRLLARQAIPDGPSA